MIIIPTEIEGCFEIELQINHDDRGFFYEFYNEKRFHEVTGISPKFVQDNLAYSEGKVLRGLHYQKGNHAQAKLVSVLEGEVQDVVVDLREKSKSYGKCISVHLTAHNKKQLFVPRGCAHGYLTLSEKTKFFYKCDNYYERSEEAGVDFRDSQLNIVWMTDIKDAEISSKDKELPSFEQSIKF